jgi:FKBP-type peptidyl-prolyl cis-trans isomerase
MPKLDDRSRRVRGRHRWPAALLWLAAAVAVAAGPMTAPSTRSSATSTAATGPTTGREGATTSTVPVPPTQTTQSTAPPVVNTQPPIRPDLMDDRVKILKAYEAGKKLRDQLLQAGANPDDLNIVQAFTTGLQGKEPPFTQKEAETLLDKANWVARQKSAETLYANDPGFRQLADENMKRSRAAIDQYSQMDGTETRNDGVLVHVIDPGNGRVIGNAKSITVRVRVCLADGTLVKATEPGQTVTVATADLLPALADACRGMKVGGHWRLVLPPEVYGLAGKPPLIGPNQAVIYNLELVGAQ